MSCATEMSLLFVVSMSASHPQRQAYMQGVDATVSDLDTDVDDTWEFVSDRSYAFSMHARVRTVLRSLSVKDLRKFYLQYICLLYTSPSPRD